MNDRYHPWSGSSYHMVAPCTTQFAPPGSGLVQSVVSLAEGKREASEVGEPVAAEILEALRKSLQTPVQRAVRSGTLVCLNCHLPPDVCLFAVQEVLSQQPLTSATGF